MRKKSVLITGASHGIGQATAIAFAKDGFDVGINYAHDSEGAKYTAEKCAEYGAKTELYKADVTSYEQCTEMVEKFVSDFGTIDVLINNAGGLLSIPEGNFEDIPVEYWDSQIKLNLSSAAYCSKVAVKYMKAHKNNGAIINISSLHSRITFTKRKAYPYPAAKAGLNHFTSELGCEVAKYGIRVNCVIPGLIFTPATLARYDERRLKLFCDRIPAGRPGTVDEITPLILFLAKEENNRYIIGQSYAVDGGWTVDGVIPGMWEDDEQ